MHNVVNKNSWLEFKTFFFFMRKNSRDTVARERERMRNVEAYERYCIILLHFSLLNMPTRIRHVPTGCLIGD